MRIFKATTILLILLAPLLVRAETPRLLRFEVSTRDLGKVAEVDGTVKLRFEYTNIANKPVTILDIHTQCGCLHPTFSKHPIKPGGKGVVDVTFDPKNRFGDFSIGLTVVASNGNYKKFNTLIAKGHVISKVPAVEINYPYALSPSLRANLKMIGMRQLSQNSGQRVRELRLFNTTATPLKLTYLPASRFITLSGPTEIGAGKEAVLTFTLNPKTMKTGDFTIRSVIKTPNEDIPIEIKGLIVEN